MATTTVDLEAALGKEANLPAEEEQSSSADGPEMYKVRDGKQVKATRADRLKACGLLCHKPDPRTGGKKGYYFKCDLIECLKCRQERAEQEKAMVTLGSNGKLIKILRVDGRQARSLVRKLKSNQYRRYPQGDDEFVFLHTDGDIDGDPVDLDGIDWMELVKTPEGANISGKLKSTNGTGAGRKSEPVRIKNVRVESVIVSEKRNETDKERSEQIDKAWEIATLVTCHLDPDLDTLYLALRERGKHFKATLRGMGYYIRFTLYAYERIKEGEVDWKDYNNRIRRKWQRLGYYNPQEPSKLPAEYLARLSPELEGIRQAELGFKVDETDPFGEDE